ncbi:MAG: hypothetical protein F9K13_00325 [Candidatus Methylomirabilis oxygeniifera]|nr:MAG: hypothetical protein F9K13_00325 [Candidatus Methylomirabilis oxyfera]
MTSGPASTPPIEIGEFHYRLRWRTRGARPGCHPSRQPGGGVEFRGHASILHHPDPRRLDVRATLRDPHHELLVRIFQQRSAIPVYVVADLTTSMRFRGGLDKWLNLIGFCASVAHSCRRTGDLFGFIGWDTRVRRDLLLPAGYAGTASETLIRRLLEYRGGGAGIQGLCEAGEFLPRARSLVFLVSDFHVSLHELDRTLSPLARHDMVPVVLWDRSELENLPPRGLVRVRDLENGRERLLWMRPVLRDACREALEHRREALRRTFLRYGRPPFFVYDRFDPDDLTRYFLETS